MSKDRDTLLSSAQNIQDLRARQEQTERRLDLIKTRIEKETENIQRRLRSGKTTGDGYLDEVLEIWQTDDLKLVTVWKKFREAMKRHEGQKFVIARHTKIDGDLPAWRLQIGLIRTEQEIAYPVRHAWTTKRHSFGRGTFSTKVVLPCNPDIGAEESSISPSFLNGGHNAGCIEIDPEELREFLTNQEGWSCRFVVTYPGIPQPRELRTLRMLIGDRAVRSFPLWEQEPKFSRWFKGACISLRRIRSAKTRARKKRAASSRENPPTE